MPELGRHRVLDRQRVDVARRQRQYGREDAADDLEEAPLRVRVDLVGLVLRNYPARARAGPSEVALNRGLSLLVRRGRRLLLLVRRGRHIAALRFF